MTEHLVKPTLPTILGSQLYHELLPLDLICAISVSQETLQAKLKNSSADHL